MQDYVSAQTYATLSAGNSRFGFAWSPRNLAGMPTAEFAAQTDALLVRLAAAIADSAGAPKAACGSSWCTEARRRRGDDGLADVRRLEAAVLRFTTRRGAHPGTAAPLTVGIRTSAGTAYAARAAGAGGDRSSSLTGELSLGPGGPGARR